MWSRASTATLAAAVRVLTLLALFQGAQALCSRCGCFTQVTSEPDNNCPCNCHRFRGIDYPCQCHRMACNDFECACKCQNIGSLNNGACSCQCHSAAFNDPGCPCQCHRAMFQPAAQLRKRIFFPLALPCSCPYCRARYGTQSTCPTCFLEGHQVCRCARALHHKHDESCLEEPYIALPSTCECQCPRCKALPHHGPSCQCHACACATHHHGGVCSCGCNKCSRHHHHSPQERKNVFELADFGLGLHEHNDVGLPPFTLELGTGLRPQKISKQEDVEPKLSPVAKEAKKKTAGPEINSQRHKPIDAFSMTFICKNAANSDDNKRAERAIKMNDGGSNLPFEFWSGPLQLKNNEERPQEMNIMREIINKYALPQVFKEAPFFRDERPHLLDETNVVTIVHDNKHEEEDEPAVFNNMQNFYGKLLSAFMPHNEEVTWLSPLQVQSSFYVTDLQNKNK